MPTQTQTHSSTEYMYLATGTAPAPPLWECSTKHKASGAQADGGTDTKSDPFQNCIHCFRCGVSSPNTPSPLHPLPLSFSQVCVGAFTCTKHVRTNVCSFVEMYYVRSPIFRRSRRRRRRREDVWGDCKSFANVYRHEFSVHNCCNGWDKTFAWPGAHTESSSRALVAVSSARRYTISRKLHIPGEILDLTSRCTIYTCSTRTRLNTMTQNTTKQQYLIITVMRMRYTYIFRAHTSHSYTSLFAQRIAQLREMNNRPTNETCSHIFQRTNLNAEIN